MSNDRIPVTKEGHAKLLEELDDLINVQRPAIIRQVASAREEGDLRENAGYDAARNEQSFIEGRIRDLESILKRIEIIDESTVEANVVSIGSTVTIKIDGELETYTIVGSVEANPSQGRISNESPFGKALIGKKVGDMAEIITPVTTLHAEVIEIA
jgi:transcription elongation factor GreA